VTSGAPSLDLFTAALLGALQGVAEFLPISSSGHLSLAQLWLGVDPAAGGHRFNIVVHAGTLLAVLVVYRNDLVALVRDAASTRATPTPTDPDTPDTPDDPDDHDDPDDPEAKTVDPARQARRTLLAIFVGCLPLGVVLLPGVEQFVVSLERQPRAVGGALLLTAAMLAFSHKAEPPDDDPGTPPSYLQALLIGVAQLFAVVPGVSRSGSTIAAALALGSGRARAARFSFLLSIPAVGAASAKEVLDLLTTETTTSLGSPAPFLVGFATSFVVGVLALSGLLALLRRFGMLPFVPYLVLVGVLAMVLGS